MGGINFGWLAVWVLSPNWLSHKLEVRDFFSRRLGEAAALGGGECGPCPDIASYTLAFALQLRKITENLSQGNQSKFQTEDPQILDATVQTFSRHGDLVPRTCTSRSETQLFMLVALLTLVVTNVAYFETSWYFHTVIFSFTPIKFIESKVQLMRMLVIRV
jgi:hypothetical protein